MVCRPSWLSATGRHWKASWRLRRPWRSRLACALEPLEAISRAQGRQPAEQPRSRTATGGRPGGRRHRTSPSSDMRPCQGRGYRGRSGFSPSSAPAGTAMLALQPPILGFGPVARWERRTGGGRRGMRTRGPPRRGSRPRPPSWRSRGAIDALVPTRGRDATVTHALRGLAAAGGPGAAGGWVARPGRWPGVDRPNVVGMHQKLMNMSRLSP